MSEDNKIIFSMVGVSKNTPAGKQIIKNIYLSFFYGAKIGIIGLNGSGKSTVMKIIAGLDKAFQGEVVFSQGYSVGYLPQEPELDPQRTVRDIVLEGAQEIVDDNNTIATIFKIPREGGESIKITSASDLVTAGGFDWSPDGNSILVGDKNDIKIFLLTTGFKIV